MDGPDRERHQDSAEASGRSFRVGPRPRRRTALVGCWLVALAHGALPGAALAAPRPNFIVILADDLGYGDLGCYGHPTIRTPHLDRLAADGLRATSFYAAATVCTPSRAGLLTGRLPVRSGLDCGPRRVLFPDSTGGIPAEEVTLAEALAPLGYTSLVIGKWHLGHLPQYLPRRHGFAGYFGIPYSNDMSPSHSPYGKVRGWPPTPLLRDEVVVEEEPPQDALTRRYTEEAIAFLRRAATERDQDPERRFLLYLAHTMPHVPLFAEAPFLGQSPRGLYGDVVEALDASVGQLREALEQLGLARDTVIVFSSDNGPWIDLRLAGGSAGLLRGGKGSTWEGGYRVPGIVCWPGQVPAGSVSREAVSALDLFPTFVAWAGGTGAKDLVLDGVDQSAHFTGQGPSARSAHFYYRERELFAVRRGPWKAHFRTQAGYGQAKPEVHDPPLLFHLERDPGEQWNAAAAEPEVLAELTALADEHRRSVVPGPVQQ